MELNISQENLKIGFGLGSIVVGLGVAAVSVSLGFDALSSEPIMSIERSVNEAEQAIAALGFGAGSMVAFMGAFVVATPKG